METQSNSDSIIGALGGLMVFLVILTITLAFYVFFCYCYKRICEKAGRKPGALIWIPIVHFIPLLEVAGMAAWMIILLLVPFVNIVVFAIMWAKICTALGKSPWLVIMLFVPILNLVFVPYLAFSD